jgi:hypothetical protein
MYEVFEDSDKKTISLKVGFKGSHSSGENSNLHAHDAVSMHVKFLPFQRTVVPSQHWKLYNQ